MALRYLIVLFGFLYILMKFISLTVMIYVLPNMGAQVATVFSTGDHLSCSRVHISKIATIQNKFAMVS